MRLMAAHAGDAHVLGPAIPSVLTPPQPATWPGETHVMRAAPAAPACDGDGPQRRQRDTS